MTDNKTTTRRSFLIEVLIGWFLLITLPIVYVIVEYLLPPKIREALLQQIFVCKTDELPINSGKLVRFGKKPAIVLHTPEDQFKSFSAVCTHLGCVVEYNQTDRLIHCNCHGSVYDLSGKNIAGPAPKPLESYRILMKDKDIFISQI